MSSGFLFSLKAFLSISPQHKTSEVCNDENLLLKVCGIFCGVVENVFIAWNNFLLCSAAASQRINIMNHEKKKGTKSPLKLSL